MNQDNKFNNLIKIFINLLIYGLPSIILLNFIIGKNFNSKNDNSNFYEALKKEKYFPSLNPYQSINSLKLNPNTFFSINKNKLVKDNMVVSLDKYGFRTNPYLSKIDEQKKCILLLGSSAAFGNGSSSDKTTISSQINKKLGRNFNVYNLSVPSWNSRQELISYLNFLNLDLNNSCSEINTISFTGTADLNNINFSKKSKLFNDNLTRSELLNSPEQYHILEKKVDFATSFDSGMRYKIRTIFMEIIELSFGNIINFLNNPEIELTRVNKISESDKSYIRSQINSFVINQKVINNITENKKGNHLVVLQPDLRNSNSKNKIWNYANKYLSNQIKDECLKVLDLRLYLTDKKIKFKKNNNEMIISLKDSIKKGYFEKNSIKKYNFFDNSHLTDNGYQLISEKIINNFNDNKKLCSKI